MKKTLKWINYLVNILFTGCIIAILLLLSEVLFFSSFKIPSDSMKPGLETGDNILVCKLLIGARLFNIFPTLRNEQVNIYRLPGLQKIKHNDILVFNFPHPQTWEKIEMNIMKYYIKRAVGLPGDTLRIVNGIYQINSSNYPVGNIKSQQAISTREKESFEEGVYTTFPFDSILNWNIQEFGPLYIPKKSDIVTLDRTNYILYKKLIEWEQHGTILYEDSTVYLNNQPVSSYQFQKNYYFVAGDRVEDSQDSRYWGLLPEEYIVGKAWIIWKSIDPYTGKFQWDRFMKRIK